MANQFVAIEVRHHVKMEYGEQNPILVAMLHGAQFFIFDDLMWEDDNYPSGMSETAALNWCVSMLNELNEPPYSVWHVYEIVDDKLTLAAELWRDVDTNELVRKIYRGDFAYMSD